MSPKPATRRNRKPAPQSPPSSPSPIRRRQIAKRKRVSEPAQAVTATSSSRKRVRQKSPDIPSDSEIPEPPSEATQGADDDSEAESVPDPEVELARAKARWTSEIYAFFDPEPKLIVEPDRIGHEFKCSKVGCGHRITRWQNTHDKSSTSNMRKHALSCWGKEVLQQAKASEKNVSTLRTLLDKNDGTIAGSFKKQKAKGARSYSTRQQSPEERRTDIAIWFAQSLRSIETINDPGLHVIMKTGRPYIELPSSKTVQRDVIRCEQACLERVKQKLQSIESRIALALDTWSSPNQLPLMGIMAYFEENGAPVSLLLDVVHVDRSHTGRYLAESVATVLKDYGMENKLLSITADNASNNDVMVKELKKLIGFAGEESQARCSAHIINLIAKSAVRVFDYRPSREPGGETADRQEAHMESLMSDIRVALAELADGIDMEDESMTAEGLNGTLVDKEGNAQHGEGDMTEWVDEVLSLANLDFEELQREIEPVQLALMKLRKLAFAIINSTTVLLPAWKRLLKRLGLRPRTIPRDVATRWNSTESMVTFAVDYEEAITAFTSDASNGLRHLEPTPAERNIYKQLSGVLQIFRQASLHVSKRPSPPLASTIHVFDKTDRIITDTLVKVPWPMEKEGILVRELKEIELLPSIRAGLALAKRTEIRYYSKTDTSNLYRGCLGVYTHSHRSRKQLIGEVIHPRFGIPYMDKEGWPEEWIEEAKRIVRKVLERDYPEKVQSDEEDSDIEELTPPSSDNIFDILSPVKHRKNRRTRPRQLDELDHYLAETIDNAESMLGEQALAWWSHHDRVRRYPRLSRFARDYLIIPSTTVDVERLFSQGRILLPHTRNRLGYQTVRALFCLGNWSKMGFSRSRDCTYKCSGKLLLKDGDPLAESESEVEIGEDGKEIEKVVGEWGKGLK